MVERFFDVKEVHRFESCRAHKFMDTIFIISIFVSLFSLALTLVGIPAQIVKKKKDLLTKIAKTLIEKETIEREEFEKIIGIKPKKDIKK